MALAALLAGGVFANVGAARAQASVVPPEFYEGSVSLDNRITFCLWMANPTVAFDRTVAEAVANALLVEFDFYEVKLEAPIQQEEDLWQKLFILLQDECDAIAGFALVPGVIFPEWLTSSRPYYEAPYVLAVTDGSYRNLGDVPGDAIVGVPIYGPVAQVITAYARTLPADRRWRRFPYDTVELQWQHLQKGVIDAAVAWGPAMTELRDHDPTAREVRLLPLDPLPRQTRDIGFLLKGEDRFLRTLLDQAIGSLADDGELGRLVAERGLPQ